MEKIKEKDCIHCRNRQPNDKAAEIRPRFWIHPYHYECCSDEEFWPDRGCLCGEFYADNGNTKE